MQNMT